MNLEQLRYFVMVAQLEHYGRAAKALYITQSALSNSMRRLEQELGVELFEHVGRNVVLTPQGKKFLSSVSGILEELDDAVEQMKGFAKESNSRIRIGAVASLLRGFLSGLLNAYNNEISGKVNFDISQKGSTKECISGLRTNLLDVAFCGFPVQESDFEWIPLVPQNVVIAVCDSHPLAKEDSVSLADLQNYRLLTYREPSYMYYALQGCFSEWGFKPVESFEDEISALSVIGSNEDAVAIMLDSIRDVVWDSLKLIPIKEFDKPYHWIGFMYRKNYKYNSEIVSFIEHMKEVCSTAAYVEPIERRYYF